MKRSIIWPLAAVLAILFAVGCAGTPRSTTTQSNTFALSSSTPLVISNTAPGDEATDKAVFVGFSTALDPSTVNASTIKVAGVAGSVSYDATNHIAYFQPASPLAANTTFNVTVGTQVASSSGTALPFPVQFSVTTRATTDTSPPGFEFHPGGECVSPNHPLAIFFTEAMDSTTLNTSTILVTGPSGPVSGTVTFDSLTRTAFFTPTNPLPAGTTFTVTLTTGIKDLGGVSLASNATFTFTTCTNIPPPPPPGPGPVPPPPGSHFCSFTKGAFQGGGPAAQLLLADFSAAFNNFLIIGTSSGFHFTWDANGISALQSFLTSPALGPSGPLPTSLSNPSAWPASAPNGGQLAEQTAALTLNIGLSGFGDSTAGFGLLILENTGTALDGQTVESILAIANTALGTGKLPAGMTFDQLEAIIDLLNSSFDNCTASAWAQTHLFVRAH